VVAKAGDTIDGKTLTGFKLPSLEANSPAINSSSNVVFYATYSEGAFVGEGIFTAKSPVLKTGDAVGGRTLEGISFVPALNDGGMVTVRGLFTSGASAILTPTTVLVKDGDRIGGKTLTGLGEPAINNNGKVTFIGHFLGGTGIFTPTALIAKAGDLIDGQTVASFGRPAINDRGTIAFQSWFLGGTESAILTPTHVLVKTGDTIGGKTLTDLFFASALNSSDTVAFTGVFPSGMGIFTQKTLLVQVGERISGQTLTGFGYPVINDSGIVAFFGTYSGGMGIFTQTSLIVKTGDTICGKTVIGLGQPAINGSGEIAFAAFFSDRSSAIVLAQPHDIAEHSRGSLRNDVPLRLPGLVSNTSHISSVVLVWVRKPSTIVPLRSIASHGPKRVRVLRSIDQTNEK